MVADYQGGQYQARIADDVARRSGRLGFAACGTQGRRCPWIGCPDFACSIPASSPRLRFPVLATFLLSRRDGLFRFGFADWGQVDRSLAVVKSSGGGDKAAERRDVGDRLYVSGLFIHARSEEIGPARYRSEIMAGDAGPTPELGRKLVWPCWAVQIGKAAGRQFPERLAVKFDRKRTISQAEKSLLSPHHNDPRHALRRPAERRQ